VGALHAALVGALAALALCDPAMALRDAARGTVTKSDDTEIVVAFGEHDQSRMDRAVMSGLCQLHWGVLSFGPDGSAIWNFEVSSLTATDRWQGQFVLHDKEDNVLGTIPNLGTFDVEVREVRQRRMEIVMPLQFDPAAFKRIGSVKMSMECGPKEA
jgi:hypothetical protein